MGLPAEATSVVGEGARPIPPPGAEEGPIFAEAAPCFFLAAWAAAIAGTERAVCARSSPLPPKRHCTVVVAAVAAEQD